MEPECKFWKPSFHLILVWAPKWSRTINDSCQEDFGRVQILNRPQYNASKFCKNVSKDLYNIVPEMEQLWRCILFLVFIWNCHTTGNKTHVFMKSLSTLIGGATKPAPGSLSSRKTHFESFSSGEYATSLRLCYSAHSALLRSRMVLELYYWHNFCLVSSLHFVWKLQCAGQVC